MKCSGTKPLLILCTLAATTGCNQLKRPQVSVLDRFGLTESTTGRTFLSVSIEDANQVMAIDTAYHLVPSWATSDPHAIPVYLVHGDTLGYSEYSKAPEEVRCIIVNDDRIPELVHSLGFDETPSLGDHIKPNQQIPSSQDIENILSIVILHEVGHIFNRDQRQPRKDATSDLLPTGDPRQVELDADLFVAERLKKARKISLDPVEYLRAHLDNDQLKTQTRPGIESRVISLAKQAATAVVLDNFMMEMAQRVPQRQLYSGPQMSLSHLDIDLRILLLVELSSGEAKQNEQTFPFVIHERLVEEKYRNAVVALKKRPAGSCCLGKYSVYIALLRDPDIDVRTGAAIALRAEEPLDPKLILPALSDALEEKYGRVPNITYVTQSLGKAAVPELIHALRNGSESVRESAVWCLVQMGPTNNASAIPTLKWALNDVDPWVREHAQHALSEHGLVKPIRSEVQGLNTAKD